MKVPHWFYNRLALFSHKASMLHPKGSQKLQQGRLRPGGKGGNVGMLIKYLVGWWANLTFFRFSLCLENRSQFKQTLNKTVLMWHILKDPTQKSSCSLWRIGKVNSAQAWRQRNKESNTKPLPALLSAPFPPAAIPETEPTQMANYYHWSQWMRTRFSLTPSKQIPAQVKRGGGT